MANGTLDQRLSTLRTVADAVNAFECPEVQKLAFEWLLGAADNVPTRPIPELLKRVLAAFDQARDDRIHSEVLAAVLGIDSVHELAEQLSRYDIRSQKNSFERGGIRRRGYDRSAVLAAIENLPESTA